MSHLAQQGRQEEVELLLKAGADADLEDSNGRTPLSYAAAEGEEGVVRLLLEHGVNPDSRDQDQCTPLMWVAHSCFGKAANVDVARLLEYNAQVDSLDFQGRTPLSHAIERMCRDDEIVVLLLEMGANMNHVDCYRKTPLSQAKSTSQKNRLDEALRKAGIRANSRLKDGLA